MEEDNEEIDIGDGIKYDHIPSDNETGEETEDNLIDDSKVFGKFARTPPSDPQVKHVTYMPNGLPFMSNIPDYEEHKEHANANYQVVKVQQIINELNYYRFEIGDTECLQQLLNVTKPLIKGDRRAKACWRHLAKRCPGLNPYEDF